MWMQTSPVMSDKRKQRDRERKQRERTAQKERTGMKKDCFAPWFRARVAELPNIPGSWSNRLGQKIESIFRESDDDAKYEDYDRVLRRLHTGTKRGPGAKTVFKVGEGLRECGVSWCSGAAALHAAGHINDFFRIIVGLTIFKHEEEAIEIAFTMKRANREIVTPVDNHPSLHYKKVMQEVYDIDLNKDERNAEARKVHQKAVSGESGATLRAVWSALSEVSLKTFLRDTDELLRFAVTATEPPQLSFDEREWLALSAMSFWCRKNDERASLMRGVIALSPLASLVDVLRSAYDGGMKS